MRLLCFVAVNTKKMAEASMVPKAALPISRRLTSPTGIT